MKFTIKEIADLILSLNAGLYYGYEECSGDDVIYHICDYTNAVPYTIGKRFNMVITKEYVSLFFFPGLNCRYQFKNTEEFNEIVSIFYDFKQKYEDFAYECLQSMIVKQSDHKNPYAEFAGFLADHPELMDDLPNFDEIGRVVENRNFNPRPRRGN